MRKLLIGLAAGIPLLAVLALAASFVASRPLFDERLDPATLGSVPIAPVEEALTFARYRNDGALHVVLVSAYVDGRVRGVDLTRELPGGADDPIRLLRRAGYDALAAAARKSGVVSVEAARLELPFDAPEWNIAVGLNYREHAQESSLDEPPFLFPKRAAPSRFSSDVAPGSARLLDYEAELGLVALEDLWSPAAAHLGLVLCNEVTDRWALVRNLDRDAAMGTTGFADGKSGAGFAPIGSLLVVPRDLESFHRRLELRLWVNGRLRQRESAAAMSWGPRQIVEESFRRRDWEYAYQGGVVPLFEGPVIRAGTILFSGTPAGVIFRPANLINPWVYLQPGDEVVVRSDYLGVIHNRVTR